MTVIAKFLDPRSNNLLAALTAAEFALLSRHFKHVSLDQGAALHADNMPVELSYFPLSGTVSLVVAMNEGGMVETATIGREGAVGLPIGPAPATAVARAIVLVPGSAITMPAVALRAILSENQHIRDIVLQYHEAMVAQIQQTAACNALHPIEGRLARWLLQTGERTGDASIPLTHETISQLLGVRRTTITLVANLFQQDGLVRCSRGRIDIVNRPKLEARACECYDVMRRRMTAEARGGRAFAAKPQVVA